MTGEIRSKVFLCVLLCLLAFGVSRGSMENETSKGAQCVHHVPALMDPTVGGLLCCGFVTYSVSRRQTPASRIPQIPFVTFWKYPGCRKADGNSGCRLEMKMGSAAWNCLIKLHRCGNVFAPVLHRGSPS